MDEEILEPLHEKPFHHQGKNVEASFHETQEKSQQVVFSSLTVNEAYQDLDVDVDVSSPVLNEHVQQSCQFSSDHEEELVEFSSLDT